MRLNCLVGILMAGTVGFAVQVGAGQAPAAKPAAKAAAPHSMTGCLAKGTEPNTYMLTQIEGNGPKQAELINVPATVKLDPHIGHKVEITGTRVTAKAAARAEAGTKKATAAEKKEEAGEHHMRPTAVRMIAATCP
jgi:hypothetical protein